jgi:hypothetical protein
MKKVIADLDNDWTLTEEEIERAIKDMHLLSASKTRADFNRSHRR